MRSSKCCHQSAHFSSVSYPVVACVNTWSQRKVAAPSDRGWKKKKNACNLYKCFHRVWKEHIVLIGSIIKQGAGFFCVCVCQLHIMTKADHSYQSTPYCTQCSFEHLPYTVFSRQQSDSHLLCSCLHTGENLQ